MCEFAKSFAFVKSQMRDLADHSVQVGASSTSPDGFEMLYLTDVGCVITPTNDGRIHADDLRDLACAWRRLAIRRGLCQTLTFDGSVFV